MVSSVFAMGFFTNTCTSWSVLCLLWDFSQIPNALSPSLLRHEPFKFVNVWTNIGNAYDPSTGIFTAPYPGLYHFSSVDLSISGENLNLKLVHNNKPTAQIWVNGGGYKTGTIDVFDVQKGDKVSVGAASGMALFSNSNKYATFSGYLITSGHNMRLFWLHRTYNNVQIRK
ncbi:complement C1q-like protein 3 [Mytilus edulis]|uniref:complement C1q-like protein 3 n=1 Tax=Mytilus edulis TaxID=6550 RepID=UPI0039F01ED9